LGPLFFPGDGCLFIQRSRDFYSIAAGGISCNEILEQAMENRRDVAALSDHHLCSPALRDVFQLANLSRFPGSIAIVARNG
jgi:hypothetical protein